MTDDDWRKWMQDTQPTQLPPQVTAPGATDSQASGPNTDPAKMVDPMTWGQKQEQAGLEDQYGTGFINFGQYGKGSPMAQQFQPIPASSGSLYDPTAPAPAVAQTPAQMPAQPDPTDYNTEPTTQEGPVMKPPFNRTRHLLAYRGGEY